MQDTYMKAIKSLDYYTLSTNFKAWISRIARNNALNYVKRRNREEIIDSDERPDVFGTTSENYFLDFATRSLTEIEKDIVIYKIVLDLKFREIAEVMELPLGTVYWNYKNAINKMKEEIRNEVYTIKRKLRTEEYNIPDVLSKIKDNLPTVLKQPSRRKPNLLIGML